MNFLNIYLVTDRSYSDAVDFFDLRSSQTWELVAEQTIEVVG